ncbi:carbon-nitrogen hydrolase family protein [Paraburkholderia sp. ZP32-5]|uniref:carbon-nitrogen hydrolase family protein n=1 Tax=Paraburkholderia sp. ZP32-5 TaxID=2883245 RepID=UPI001F1931B9|nr:carbon-nitrogen hydrolase family protein [Paraburkholderia sp. ZP32-5]
MLVATLQPPASVWFCGKDDVITAWVESEVVNKEFDILVLPECAAHLAVRLDGIGSEGLVTPSATLRYWLSLSYRKHAVVVVGAVESARNKRGKESSFLTTLVAFEGKLIARYVKVHLDAVEKKYFKPGHQYHCIVKLPFFTAAVTSGSELLNPLSTAAFDGPGITIALVSGAISNESVARQIILTAKQFGIYIVFSNPVGSCGVGQRKKHFCGRSGVYTRLEEPLAETVDGSAIGIASIPDIPKQRQNQGRIWYSAPKSTLRYHRSIWSNDTMWRDGFADPI